MTLDQKIAWARALLFAASGERSCGVVFSNGDDDAELAWQVAFLDSGRDLMVSLRGPSAEAALDMLIEQLRQEARQQIVALDHAIAGYFDEKR